jgi:aspartyl protease family protein
MATGFMQRIVLCLGLAGAAGGAAAAEVSLIGVIGNKAAVLAVDGGEPKTVKVGQAWKGIKVLQVEKERASIEIDGATRVLALGQHYRSASAGTSERQSVTLAADGSGHFFAEGMVNGNPMRFVVDTGATLIALPGADARRLGLDYRKGPRGVTQTANGPVTVFGVKLDRVRVGGIEVHGVDGVVIEQGLPLALLGMSFLNRVEMRRDGDRMTLIRRF